MKNSVSNAARGKSIRDKFDKCGICILTVNRYTSPHFYKKWVLKNTKSTFISILKFTIIIQLNFIGKLIRNTNLNADLLKTIYRNSILRECVKRCQSRSAMSNDSSITLTAGRCQCKLVCAVYHMLAFHNSAPPHHHTNLIDFNI